MVSTPIVSHPTDHCMATRWCPMKVFTKNLVVELCCRVTWTVDSRRYLRPVCSNLVRLAVQDDVCGPCPGKGEGRMNLGVMMYPIVARLCVTPCALYLQELR